MAGLNLALFEALNALVGRSFTLDSLIALSLDNVLVKAGPIGACFFYAWYRQDASRPAEGVDDLGGPVRRSCQRKRILLVTLLALFLIAQLSKALSESRMTPRPFLLAQPSYVLNDGALAEAPRPEFRTLQTGGMRSRVEALREGRLDANDLATFPSDHAAFFLALSLGIWLACRRAGAVALAWTLAVTLAGRVAAGMHWPVDIVAGMALGAAVLAALQLAFAGRAGRLWRPVLRWAERWPGLTAALLFLLLLEAANTMQTLKRALELASALAGRLL